MTPTDYSVTILVDKTPEVALAAIKNFRAWWSEQIEGATDRLDTSFFYHYKDIHLCKIKFVTEIPNQKLVYEVLENEFSFVKDKREWVGSKLVFELSAQNGKTKIKFTHMGLIPENECYKVCFDAWTGYITKSLFKLISTGVGEPNPADGEGFNALLAEKWKLND